MEIEQAAPANDQRNEHNAPGGETGEARRQEKDSEQGFKFHDRRYRPDEDDNDEDEEPVERKPTYVEQLEQRATKAEQQLAEYIKAYKEKVEGEWQSYKDRLERESQRQLDQDRKRIVSDLLEVLDNLELTLASSQTSDLTDALIEGVRLVYSQFLSKLQALGLDLIEAENADFDPTLHEAVSMETTDKADLDGKVVEVYKRGYTFAGTLLRPAMVRVARKQP